MLKSAMCSRLGVACLSFAAFAAINYFPQSAHAGVVSVPTLQAGATPFIQTLSANYSGGSLQSVGYVITPLAGSLTRPFAITYPSAYLATTGGLPSSGSSVTFSVFGLYAGTTNTVNLSFTFTDGTVASQSITVTTAPYSDPCVAFNTPTFAQHRTSMAQLNFDYFLIKDNCSTNSPAIVDTDGNFRWVGDAGIATSSSILYNNGIYLSNGSGISRIELTTGAVSTTANYSGAPYNVTYTGHHNIDPGRDGLLLDVNTTTETESVNLEIDPNTGAVLNAWDMGEIISAAMTAGGDNPTLFDLDLNNPSIDWFHNNATAYNPSDNTLIVSSRENFVIAVDYDTPADGQKKIHWILGDQTKAWGQFKSLTKYALKLSGANAQLPVGQHAVSIDHLGNLLLFDDGAPSQTQSPQGVTLPSSSVQEYVINPQAMTATGGYTWMPSPALYNAFCGSVYDVNGTYLVDMPELNAGSLVELWGLDNNSNTVFNVTYPGGFCAGWNAVPLLAPPVAPFAPSFTLTPATTTLAVAAGGSATNVLSVNPAFGFDSPVNFTISGLPTALAGSSLSSMSSMTGTTLTVTTPSNTPGGYYPVKITGTSGSTQSTATVSVIVSSPIMSSQTITFAAIPNQTAGTTLGIAASASSGLSVSFVSSTPTVCTLTGNTVSLLTAGTCTISATQAGTFYYASASIVQSFSVLAAGTITTGVSLTAIDNIYALASPTTPTLGGGLDGAGDSLAANMLGSSVIWSGSTFTLGSASTQSGIAAKTIQLPAGNYSSLQFLATGVYGPIVNQVFTVTYTDGTISTLTQSISDWGYSRSYPGESIAATTAYRLTSNGSTQNGPWYIYGYSIALNSSKTVQSIKLPNTAHVVVLGIDLVGAGTASTISVNLGSVDNVNAIASSGTPPVNGGFDSVGNAFASNLLGTSASYAGSGFALGSTMSASAVTSKTVSLPAGNYSALKMLASGSFTGGTALTFTVTYTDSTISTFTQSVSDWKVPQNYPGESNAVTMAYRITPTGGTEAGPWYIYGYTFALNSSKTVQSITLPNTVKVAVFAIDLVGAQAASSVALAAVDNVNAIANSGTPPSGGGVDTSSYAFAANLLGATATYAGSMFSLGSAASASAVTSKTVTLPAGNYSALKMLATAIYGPIVAQTFTVTYTDSTTSSFTQSVSDWGAPRNYPGESSAVTTAYRITPSGATQAGPWYIYGYTFALNNTKTVQSITLPNIKNVVVFAIDLAP